MFWILRSNVVFCTSTMSTTSLNVAIIGGGLIGPRHAQSVILNSSAHLLALVDPAPHGAQTALSLNTIYFPSIASLLSSSHPKPDAAVICTPNSTHVSVALELIAAGVHVLVEKPIATNIPDGIRAIDAAREKGVKLLVGHHRRFNTYLLSAQRIVKSGTLGTIIAVQGTWSLQKPSSYFNGMGEWRRNGDSGGVVLINLIHEVDLLQYLLGPITSVAALPTRSARGFDADEGAAILLKFERGIVGTFVLSDNAASPWNFESGTGENPMIPHVPKDRGAGGFYRIMGTGGSLSVPDLRVYKGPWDEKLEVEEMAIEKQKVPFDLQIQHLVDVVRGKEEPSCSGEEALRAVVVCEAIRRAMKTGGFVDIEGFEIKERKSGK